MVITLNGESYELDQPVTVSALLERLDIDPRRVAIEHNLEIIRRRTFENRGNQGRRPPRDRQRGRWRLAADHRAHMDTPFVIAGAPSRRGSSSAPANMRPSM
jgi:thiamine biosynthesis protein ThiS